jgi:hypothetical protein
MSLISPPGTILASRIKAKTLKRSLKKYQSDSSRICVSDCLVLREHFVETLTYVHDQAEVVIATNHLVFINQAMDTMMMLAAEVAAAKAGVAAAKAAAAAAKAVAADVKAAAVAAEAAKAKLVGAAVRRQAGKNMLGVLSRIEKK